MDNQTILFNIEKCDRDIDKLEYFIRYFNLTNATKPLKLSVPGISELQIELMTLETPPIVEMLVNRLEAVKAKRGKLIKDLYYGQQ